VTKDELTSAICLPNFAIKLICLQVDHGVRTCELPLIRNGYQSFWIRLGLPWTFSQYQHRTLERKIPNRIFFSFISKHLIFVFSFLFLFFLFNVDELFMFQGCSQIKFMTYLSISHLYISLYIPIIYMCVFMFTLLQIHTHYTNMYALGLLGLSKLGISKIKFQNHGNFLYYIWCNIV
jgi:hypothetical protein